MVRSFSSSSFFRRSISRFSISLFWSAIATVAVSGCQSASKNMAGLMSRPLHICSNVEQLQSSLCIILLNHTLVSPTFCAA